MTKRPTVGGCKINVFVPVNSMYFLVSNVHIMFSGCLGCEFWLCIMAIGFLVSGLEFNGDELKGIIVDEKITYIDLLDKVYVEFFIGENLVDDRGRRTPLCITIKRRESLNQGEEVCYPVPFDSGCVSNRTSGFVPTAQKSEIPPFLALLLKLKNKTQLP